MTARTIRLVPLVAAWLLASGCAFGHLREVDVDALPAYRKVDAVSVEALPGHPRLGATLAAQVRAALAARGLRAPAPGTPALRVVLQVRRAIRPAAKVGAIHGAVASLGGRIGIASKSAGTLEVEAVLMSPDGKRRLGHARWLGTGDPDALAPKAGARLGAALARAILRHQKDGFQREAADERLFLSPTAETMKPGEVAISNDEVLLFRVAGGVTPHLQLDLWLGALPLPPVAGAAPLPLPGGVAGAGGAAGLLLGVADLGIKWRFLDETRLRPGIAVSYDLVDLFGAGLAAGGIAVAGGGGAAGAAFVGTGGANMQLNLLALTASKHFGPVEVSAGTWLMDNHHFLPQSEHFTLTCPNSMTGSTSCGGGGNSGGQTIAMLPDELQPYLTARWDVSHLVALGTEIFPRLPLKETMVSTGVRLRLGFDHAAGPVALDRIRLRLDLSLLWMMVQDPTGQGRPSHIGYVPTFGVGLYFR